eukprot:CAMPEP_0181217196 /NCGR_PEP_ID=MMETSP1096-20121128/27015_1 /TAXON_ID=156174 ORGANISM="Chrysochromulina ericina, Strain CCMP281" /NCGR_SAMPLE_ID=MMETSP1096 /ASSEMBLY_ACC=CAM_ASM_000453 /LENGTH=62 /DNA_ID=CAMNT_0023309297 /DNA_START=203 /DNA_END=391 /DNA_ORIENTATION=+
MLPLGGAERVLERAKCPTRAALMHLAQISRQLASIAIERDLRHRMWLEESIRLVEERLGGEQ